MSSFQMHTGQTWSIISIFSNVHFVSLVNSKNRKLSLVRDSIQAAPQGTRSSMQGGNPGLKGFALGLGDFSD